MYATNKWEVAAATATRAEKAGCTALAVTVDRSGGRNQETLFRLRPDDKRDCNGCHDRSNLANSLKNRAMWKGIDVTGLRNIQSSAMTWDFFKRMRDHTKMKLLAKGILAWEDAVMAADAGLDGIIVSNHGARSEDSGRATIDALPEIVEAVKGRAEIVVDGGVLRGTDIVKAIALGANAVGIGRLQGLAMAAAGEDGMVRMVELLQDEVTRCLGLLGVTSFAELDKSYVEPAEPLGRTWMDSAFPLLKEGY